MYRDIHEKQAYFIKLSDLVADYKSGNITFSEYDNILRGIRAIWAELADENYSIPPSSRVELVYKLHAPLNLPKYVGTPTSEEENAAAQNREIIEKVSGHTQWNTFVGRYWDTTIGQGVYSIIENAKAGAYISAPTGRGYIGSYVWNDFNYDAKTNEAEYAKSDNGREILSKLTTDINFDGEFDDPGVNGVTVELLTKSGYAVNKDGQAIAPDPDPSTNTEPDTTRYVLIDEETGEYIYSDPVNKVYK